MMRKSALSLIAFVAVARAWTTLVVPHADGQDDTPALQAALNSGNYSTDATILFQKGVHYNILTPLVFPKFTNVEVAIEGNLTYPTDIPTIQNIVGSSSFKGHWFYFSGGTNVTLRGSKDPNWGWVDAHGQAWWDDMNQVNRPHGWNFQKMINSTIRDMKLWKPIAWSFASSGSQNLHVYNNQIYAVSNSKGFPFNTDGFSSGGVTNGLYENNHIENGDDCMTVGNGAKNIHFRNSYCKGGHGLSIGSLGKNGQVADVQNILFENVIMYDCLYGARFKSWTGGNGLARNITWKNIGFDKVPFPIYVTQNYWDQNLGPKPNSTSVTNTAIADMSFINFAGEVYNKPGYVEGTCISDPCWYYVPDTTGREVIILDLYKNTTSNIVAKRIAATTYSHQLPTVMCDPSVVSGDLGFKCWDGAYVPTAKGLLGRTPGPAGDVAA